MNSVTYAIRQKTDPWLVANHRGEGMDAKKAKLEDTYVFDEDVMDEMENFEVTQVLQETENDLSNTITQENKFLEDVEDSTVVLDQSSSKKKS